MDILFANPNIFVGENILEESENLHNVDQVKRNWQANWRYMLSALGRLSGDKSVGSLGLRSVLIYSFTPLQPLRVRGCILTLVERMDEEFTKIMQNTDPHSQGEPEKVWASVRGNVQGVKPRMVLNESVGKPALLIPAFTLECLLGYWTALP